MTKRGRHEQPSPDRGSEAGPVAGASGASALLFRVLAGLLCALLGVALVSQVRSTDSGDGLDTARPADLLVLLDSLRQRESVLNTEVTELQHALRALGESGSSNQAAINDARDRLAALAITVGTVGAAGSGVRITIEDPQHGVSADAMLDVINELRASGAETMEIRDDRQGVRVGVNTWVGGIPGELEFDGRRLSPPYSIVVIGDPPTLAAAVNIPGGAVDSVRRQGGAIEVQQSDRVDVTALRQPKPRQYAQSVK